MPCLRVSQYRARLACLALFFLPLFAQAARQVTLTWDVSADPSVAGYHVRYGTVSGQYPTAIDVGNTSTATITNLTPGTDFYFVVTAYRVDSLESTPSNEVVFSSPPLIPPSVRITSPIAGTQVNGPISVDIEAQAADPDGVLARVELFQGTEKISESTAAPFSAASQSLPPGQYSFSAVAVDQSGGRWPSIPVNFQVVELKADQARLRADGIFEMTVTGAAGSSNRVWYSSDLVHWDLLSTIENTAGTVTVEDPTAATVSQRFYKITSP